MEKPRTTPKDFFIWFGAMLSLYWATISFIFLFFNYINYTWPNSLSYLPNNPYDSGIGFQMASIVVFLPIYMLLSWLIRRDIALDPTRKDIWVRRWALILTLFIAGITMAGDLVTLLATFFSGDEVTLAFSIKVVFLFMVGAMAFMHFIADYRGYWDEQPQYRRRVCWGIGLLAVLTIATGFVLFGTPAAARQYRFDEQRVNNLQEIQSQVTYYYQQKRELPPNLSSLNSATLGFAVPTDPDTNAAYEYKQTGALSFELCATFSRQSLGQNPSNTVSRPYGTMQDSWDHSAGRTCFTRSIDPAFYPQNPPQAKPL
jgi:hypothetical protein